MDQDLTYLPTDDFPLRWRFFEDAEKYTILPEEDRANFKPLSEASSRTLWDGWARPILENLDRATPAIHEGGDDGWEGAVRNVLRGCVNLPDTEPLYFFWEPTTAVEATWGIFLTPANHLARTVEGRCARPRPSSALNAGRIGMGGLLARGSRPCVSLTSSEWA